MPASYLSALIMKFRRLRTAYFCLPGLCLTAALHAAELPTRTDIFAWTAHQPIISSSGRWIASIAANGRDIELRQTTTPAKKITLTPPDLQVVLWQSWSHTDPERLLIFGMKDGDEPVLSLDPASGQFSSVLGKSIKPYSGYAHYLNDYKFILARYKNSETGQYLDLTPDGKLQVVADVRNAIPAYLKPERGFFNYSAPQSQQIVWQFGLDSTKRRALQVQARDQRRGTKLMSVSTDNKAYMFSSVESDTLGLAEFDLASGEKTWLVQEKADLAGLTLDPKNGKPDAVTYETDVPHLKVLNPDVASDVAVLTAKNWNVPLIKDRSPNDQFWLVQYPYRDGAPRWVWYDRAEKKLHDLPFPAAAPDNGPRIRSFAVQRPGQPDISGYVTLPAAGVCETKKCPAVLFLHGGPGARDYAAHTAERTWLTSRGIIVINVNYRGSSGFGKQFEAQDVGQWYDGIPRDALDAFQYALQHFPIAPTRVALIGSSFAGSLALHLMANTPHFQCAVVDSTATDQNKFVESRLAKFGENSDLLHRLGDPRKPADREKLAGFSAVNQLDKLKNHAILYLHGAKDEISPISIVEEFVQKMLQEDNKFIYAHFPNEGHGFSSQNGRAIYHALTEQFLAPCLGVPVQPITQDEIQLMQGNVSLFGKNTALFKVPE
jgi:pimeloyl-ACP methyl ester carboxylesterase